ncbi:FadR/GntR family transcriptional regulator [Salinarimonas soli]|nr:FCD domain-containing protein [Salinarimonas soli]
MKPQLAPFTANRQPVPQGVAQYLIGVIETQALRAGDRLPSERVLAQRLGISRSSIRQALSALESRGYVSVQPGRGIFVATRGGDPTAWRFEGCTPRDVYEARICIESFAAARAAMTLSEAELSALASSVHALEEAAGAGDIAGMAAADSAFHDLIIGACGNPIIQAMYAPVREMMVESQKLPMVRGAGLDATVAEHESLLACCEARDADGAAMQMRRHIGMAAARLGIEL